MKKIQNNKILIVYLSIFSCLALSTIFLFACSKDTNQSFLNVYGEDIKTPNKTLEYNNTIMAGNGKLFRKDDILYEFDKKTEDENIANFIYIFDNIRKDYPILYVQKPFKYNKKTDVLTYNYTINIDKKYDYWCEQMRAANVPVLDLRKANKNHNEFYAGDHHWTIESSYYAAIAIEKKLAKLYPQLFSFEKNKYQKNSFKKITRGGFIGEEANRSDKLFMGSEKISFLVPSYATSFDMYKYEDGQLLLHTKGPFDKALIDRKRLNEKETGKYNASMFWTSNEARIYNHRCKNKKKMLLIANSFGRSMVMYLSLGFHETRYIDPQQDRFNGSLIKYVHEFNPDVVVVMFNQSIMTR